MAILTLLPIDLGAQCTPLRFNTSFDSGWKTCTASPNPNSARGTTAWLLYDLGEQKTLGESWFWNYNAYDDLTSGVTTMVIDYKTEEGGEWMEHGTYDLDLADGTSTYSGQNGPDFGGLLVRYILVTFVQNGGSQCFGIGEWMIETLPTVISNTDEISAAQDMDIFPNPATETVNIVLAEDDCDDCRLRIVDPLGRHLATYQIDDARPLSVNVAHLHSGVYQACLEQNSGVICKQFSVIKE